MNILININKKFCPIATVMLYSLLQNNLGEIQIFIFHSELEDDDVKSIQMELDDFSGRFKIHSIKVSNFNPNFINAIHHDSRWSVEVYYRILAPIIIPQTIDKILYLDSDVIVNGSLRELYELDLGSNCFAAAEDTFVGDFIPFAERLGINKTRIYYNSGVVLFNLEKLREIITISNINILLQKHSNDLIYPDQDILNILFDGQCVPINYRIYNFICGYKRYSKRQMKYYQKNAVIFHYGGVERYRPWNYNYIGSFSGVYWKYAQKTCMGKKYWKFRLLNPILKYIYRIYDFVDLYIIYNLKRIYK